MNQMQKTLASLGALLAVAGGLAFFAYTSIYRRDEDASKKKAIEQRLMATDDGKRAPDGGAAKIDFTKLTVNAKSQTTVLEKKEGERWRIVSPVSAKTDPLVLDALLSQLQASRFKTTLEGEATDAELKTYGLDAPSFSVEAEAVVDGRPLRVKLEGGIENPFDGTVYMRRDGTRTVHMAEGGVRWSFAKTTFDLRDKEIFALEEVKLKRVTLKSKANDWELERGEDKLWHLVRPQPMLADPTQVASLIGSLRGERATDFPGEVTDARLASLGFNDPRLKATFVTEAETVTFTLAVPSPDAGDVTYVLREDATGRTLAQVSANARNIDRNATELRDRSLLPFAKQLVTKITFAAPDKPLLVVERDPGASSVESCRFMSQNEQLVSPGSRRSAVTRTPHSVH